MATRIFDEYIEKWPLVVPRTAEEESELLLSVLRCLIPFGFTSPADSEPVI